MNRKTQLTSLFLHAILLTVVYVFQGMVFPYVRLNGFVPLLLPIAATGVAIYEGRYTGGFFGIFAGILCDVSFNEPAGVFTVMLTLSGLLIGTLADTIITRGFVMFIASCVVVLALSAFVQLLPLFFTGAVPLAPLVSTGIQQTVYSLIFTIPIWFFVRALGERANRISSSGRQL